MVRRRRYATRDELAELLVARGVDRPAVEGVLDALRELGAPVDQLVRVVVDEDLDSRKG